MINEALSVPDVNTRTSQSSGLTYLYFYRTMENTNFAKTLEPGALSNNIYVSDKIVMPADMIVKTKQISSCKCGIVDNKNVKIKQSGLYKHHIEISFKITNGDGTNFSNVLDFRTCVSDSKTAQYSSIENSSVKHAISGKFTDMNEILYIEHSENSIVGLQFHIIQSAINSHSSELTIFNLKWTIQMVI